ncbi:hypothetical protein C2G38_2176935 [Gigaspora rosea]|uniref:Protein kinase domain-containing protein n=1 Tax=Gigaspora rosea TaxID=44941 RepID=A0A397VH79_9GLOM|nr:hypothetical protein C2G38_2176935 [Gigaspora rosea]
MTTKAKIDPETIPSTKPELGELIEEGVNSRYIENLQDLQHQESFVKFQATLRKIKIFVEKVTRLRDTKTSLYQEISHIKSKLEDTKDSIQQINPTLLKELSFSRRSDRRGKLDECQNIVKFYGLSEVDGKVVMIFEWAEMGNLKEVYNQERIIWNLKAQIVFEICKGIML